ncbi:hypothetical protein BAUCODRAFT_568205 [Baudoinia panamericana UAMH 10762]|uniref:Uncharacterized protein n=1 Tax=Baudoinia panamericana (strain UAMH 10762) TaxID=717646 RepID=M2MPG7_BAUPA|nr:uncharacterized protein BAUCODRAFT_568205 [Baudoinia panamericana UAMH 10762]EMC93358.1 hypothetical protein BAUCODRAFT_568205 [Baudoinia panamericana UAMH 10762]
MGIQETYRPAFDTPPGAHLAGISISSLKLPTPYVSYGLPYQEAAAKHIRSTLHVLRVYVVSSTSLAVSTDRLDRLVTAVGEDAICGITKGITPHTPFAEILEITAKCRENSADCLLALGAGSITDGCKIVALYLANDIDSMEELAKYAVGGEDCPKSVKEPSVPLITIPTTLSGGEYFSLAGGTDDSTHHKHGFLRSGMGVKLIILDPDLCTTTPAYHWLSTGALCSLHSTQQADANAEQGLRLLVPGLLRTKGHPGDLDARRKCQQGVNLAMGSIRAGVPIGGSHAIGHQLGPLGVPHGVTSCIMCPAVMKYNMQHGRNNPDIARRQEHIRDVLWAEPEVTAALQAAGLRQDSADLGDVLDAVIRALALPRSLRELNVSPQIIPSLSEGTLEEYGPQLIPYLCLRRSK